VRARQSAGKQRVSAGAKAKRPKPLAAPSETELLDLCKAGEDEVSEFKAGGTETRKITKEIAAFLHTRRGGIIYYGVDDDGTVSGTDLKRQALDQQIQNSVRNTIKPAPHVAIKTAKPLGTEVLTIHVPPWDKKTIHYYEDRVYIRKGTNVFVATPDEIKRLHRGEYIA
jgi:predicted HTH transcriptional regulator